LKQRFDALDDGEAVKLLAQSGFEPDLHNWLVSTGNSLLGLEKKADHLEAVIRK
jgi:TusA-related sulfurtransferase